MNDNSTHTMRVLDKDMNVIIERDYTRPAVCHATTLHHQSKRSLCDKSKLIVANFFVSSFEDKTSVAIRIPSKEKVQL